MKKFIVLLLVLAVAMTGLFATTETDTVQLTYTVGVTTDAKFTAGQVSNSTEWAAATDVSTLALETTAKTFYASYTSNKVGIVALNVAAKNGALVQSGVTTEIPYTLTFAGQDVVTASGAVSGGYDWVEATAGSATRYASVALVATLGTVPANAESGTYADTVTLTFSTDV